MIETPRPRLASEVTKEWLTEVLRKGGYDANPHPTVADVVVARYDGPRPNLTVRVRPGERIVSFLHFWKLKKPGWGQDKDFTTALEKANGNSWYDSFSRDKDGDLMVSFYLFLVDGITEGDVLALVEKEANHFMQVTTSTGLRQWIL
jgi:hypothetical protein